MLNLILSNHTIFGAKHIIIIAITLALIVGMFIISKKFSFNTVCRAMLIIGIISETLKIFTYIIINEETHGGILPKTDLPFHLCSIQILFVIILNYSKNENLKRFLMSFMYPSCLIGGFAAILIATASSLNNWVITFQYFIYHAAIIVLALNICTRKEIKLTVKDYFNSLKFIGILMFVAIYINSIIDDGSGKINFMYVVSPPQSGLPFLTEKYGWFVYIAHYACLIIFALTTCYIKPIIVAIKEKAKSKKTCPSIVPEIATTIDTENNKITSKTKYPLS